MYATFVVSGSPQEVHVDRDIQVQVHKELEPPYEELFDAVEEHVLRSLLEPWNMLTQQEKGLYEVEVKIHKIVIADHVKLFFFPIVRKFKFDFFFVTRSPDNRH